MREVLVEGDEGEEGGEAGGESVRRCEKPGDHDYMTDVT